MSSSHRAPARRACLLGGALLAAAPAYAVNIDAGAIQGSFNSTVSAGGGMRMKNPSCALVGDTNGECGASANTAQASNSDDGNLNYRKGQLFSAYIKGVHELLLGFPEGYKFMARGSWLDDFAAPNTNRTELSPTANQRVAHDVRLLDLWVSKDFSIGSQSARLRLGNQVINWGESLYALGGINATNALDLQKLQVPGTQVKEAVLPSPMLSFATGLGHGVNIEAYYQFGWNRSLVPPVGTYFSTADVYDAGRNPLFINTVNANAFGTDSGTIGGPGRVSHGVLASLNPAIANGAFAGPPFNTIGIPFADDARAKSQGQFGVSMHYKPTGYQVDFGFYALNYHDKVPVLNALASGQLQWQFLENRQLYGISTNFPLGDWAIGGELSYRPKDAISLTGCFNPGGPLDANTNAVAGSCKQWADNKKYQLDLTALLSLTPGEYGPILNLLGHADSAALTIEGVVVHYPGVSNDMRIFSTVGGTQVMQGVSAGYSAWLNQGSVAALGYPTTATAGTSYSGGITVDFNWTYDGGLLSGWQVTPGVTFTDSLFGYTPTFSANYMRGAKSANFYVLFAKNNGKWNAGVNYTAYFGGNNLTQPLADRNFLGAFVSYNF
ncbi:hypothetical protein PTE30175_00312 [Pandoraea terrae]|uniref:Arylsulfatase n=1 Tax=Pandoraea terrae TaxID=1537710 RepID=A0A5E4RPP9_9BURK|nr:DUF1302 domain-containing protein [Pandoraea terrae]VVD65307.1 hypothetical protein PTE30175_00312 [Pandoraea terrae]